MCGITGFNWEDKKLVKEMTDVLRHRGPDQYDYYTDEFVSLGHRRLSIIDLSEKGRQPLCNERGNIWITYNGEIYNFQDIKKHLEHRGHRFKSNTDTEVIVHAYEEYGTNCVNLFNGMFAFAIWDTRNKKIILARDRLGVKPLYYSYYQEKNKLIFASELKSLIRNPTIKRDFNLSGLSQLVYYGYIINGETLIKDVNELPPGHLLVYDFKKLEVKKYWELNDKVDYYNEDFFIRKLRDLLEKSVRKRLVADVPLGASLSGGLDSGSVVAFMSKFSDKPIKTFTMGFNDESDEFISARKVAEFCKTEHHEVTVSFDEITRNLAKILWHAEIPFSKPAMFATYFLSEGISKNKVIVDLSGEGADELFAGYNRYNIYLDNDAKMSNIEKAQQIVSGCFFGDNSRYELFNKNICDFMDENLKPENYFLPSLEKTSNAEHINAALNFEIKKQLPGVHLLRLDKMSMAHSHEIRTPFMDYELVEFAMTIPSNLKWHGDNKKYILQKAMEGFLPSEVVYRTKLPFHIPLLRYFQEDFLDMAEKILSNSSLFNKRIVNQGRVMNQIKMIKNKFITEDNSLRQILFLVNLELFYKLFLEKEKVTEGDLNINNFI